MGRGKGACCVLVCWVENGLINSVIMLKFHQKVYLTYTYISIRKKALHVDHTYQHDDPPRQFQRPPSSDRGGARGPNTYMLFLLFGSKIS